ncbi:MAG: hypothetical protein K1Y36_06100 [Blastocatellia bacterium]|nr:hypothetical protein [Blastocatellia bacterium]
MSTKPPKPTVTDRICPKCDARITFPDDVKTVLCPKCRQTFRVYKEEGKIQLKEPDRKDDLAVASAEIESINFEISILLDKVTRLERFSYVALIAAVIPFGFLIFELKAALAPRGTWSEFNFVLVIFLIFLGAAYWLAFNPVYNRKIMKLQEDRTQLRRRMESM